MQTLTLLHSESFPIGQYVEALKRESISPLSVHSLDSVERDGTSLRVVLVDQAIARSAKASRAVDSRVAIVGIGLDEAPKWLTDDNIYLHLPENPSPTVLLNSVRRAYQFLYQKIRADQLERQLSERTRELQEVSEVGIALSTVRDHAVLLTMILTKGPRALARRRRLALPARRDRRRRQGSALEARAERLDRRRLRGKESPDHAQESGRLRGHDRRDARHRRRLQPAGRRRSTRSTAPSTRRTGTSRSRCSCSR